MPPQPPPLRVLTVLEFRDRLTPDEELAITAAGMGAAQASSARRLGALRAASEELDSDMARGLAFAFLVKALARHAVAAWEGAGDDAGKPLPLSPKRSGGW